MMISFKSKITIKVLDYYFMNPEAMHYVNELADILELDPKNLHRKLLEFEKEGLFFSEFRGKQRYFYLNNHFVLLPQYKEIFVKTFGIENRLKKTIELITDIKKAFIFGSYANNTMDAGSDIDLFVVGNFSLLNLQKKIYDVEKEVGREINIVAMTENEFEQKQKKDFFLKDILKNKIIELK